MRIKRNINQISPLVLLLSAGSVLANSEAQHLSKQRSDAALAMMAFNVIPDVTASNVSVRQDSGDDASMFLSQLGGGATISETVPIYLEGSIGYSEYDPDVVFTDVSQTTEVKTKWSSYSLAGGIGYDLSLAENWVLRPILNFAVGDVARNLDVQDSNQRPSEQFYMDEDLMSALGLGASLMLDYEFFSAKKDVDFEMRYSYVGLKGKGDVEEVEDGHASANNVSVYYRERRPTGYYFLGGPLRYLVEGAHTQYLGAQKGVLGYDSLTSMGLGLEIDTSKYSRIITRTRLVARYLLGDDSNGYSIGLACSF